MATHEVLNQPPPLVGYDVYSADLALAEAVRREGAGWAEAGLSELGRLAGSAEAIAWGAAANANPPVLRTHDGYGHRLDEVDFHPAYHKLMETAVGHGLHAAPWRDPRQGAHVARAAGFAIWSQVDAGHGCPVSMTYSAVPALRIQADVAQRWEPGLTSLSYDPVLRPAAEKQGLLCGMAMTEKQGGSDLRAGATRAEPAQSGSGPGAEYVLTGHKWFCSAPMCDAFLVLAQAPGGLSCLLMPRFRPDGTRNAIAIQRLKDKLGNRSNASSEIEMDRAWAQMVGEEGAGVRTIIEMVNHTRLDCVTGAVAGMRQAVAQAVHHCRHRRAFGSYLSDQPLMAAVLADLALEAEAATSLMARLAGAFDRAAGDRAEAAFRRIATALGKYWVCKRHPALAAEALECLGGNGYVEESIMPRLFRESPLNSIWEGSGNVICLDVLRAMRKEPASVEALLAELAKARGADARLDMAIEEVALALPRADEQGARRLAEQLALALQASLLVRFAPQFVADAFCATRLAGDWGRAFGTLPAGTEAAKILERAWPEP